MMHSPAPVSVHQSGEYGCAPCQQSQLSQAVSAPWAGSQISHVAAARPELAPYFGSANLLFFTLEDNSHRFIATGLGSDFSTSLVSPDASTGFDVSIGRYLDCNRFGFGVTYLNWDPSSEVFSRSAPAGTIRSANLGLNGISIDAGSGVGEVYDIIDGTDPNYSGATGIRLTRDLDFQGIEANLYSFGLMGAQRAAYPGCGPQGIFGRFLTGIGLGGHGRGTTGASGPLVRTNTGRVRVVTSHGFRWFQADDSLEIAYNTEDTGGAYDAADLFENIDVENNLYGYQFGGRLTYCLSNRMNLNIGGKFGIYGNDAELRYRVGTRNTLAYINGDTSQVIDTEASDTVLATLGELDLGLGYRVNNAWTVRGGYRLLGLNGVATSVDSIPTDFTSVANAGKLNANDSYLIHGGYVGLEYNW